MEAIELIRRNRDARHLYYRLDEAPIDGVIKNNMRSIIVAISGVSITPIRVPLTSKTWMPPEPQHYRLPALSTFMPSATLGASPTVSAQMLPLAMLPPSNYA
jgi:hypothetical protein